MTTEKPSLEENTRSHKQIPGATRPSWEETSWTKLFDHTVDR